MQIQDMPIEEIKPSPRNARSHPEKQVEKIAKSIKQLGFRNPVLIDTDNVVIAGHGRLLAARHLGMTKLPVIVISDLNEPQKRALSLTLADFDHVQLLRATRKIGSSSTI